jgi:hypothetical protein
MRNLKKLPASLLLTIAFALPAFGGVIECPVTGTPPPDSPAMFQPGPTLEAAPEEPEGFAPEDDKSLFEVTLDLLRGVALTLF